MVRAAAPKETGSVIGGQVTFERTIQVNQYEPKKVSVTISFEGGQSMLDAAGSIARAKVTELLGLKEATAPAATTVSTPAETKPGQPAPTSRTKADLEREVTLAAGGKPEPKKPPKAVTTTPDVGLDLDFEAPEAEAPSPEEFLEDEPQITDKEIYDEIGRVNKRINNAVAIKGVIAEYVKPPRQAREIPQVQREEFLAKLKAL